MLHVNEARWDRLARVLFGALVLASGLEVFTGVLGIGLTLLGLAMVVTGGLGWCPAYALFHRSTCRPA